MGSSTCATAASWTLAAALAFFATLLPPFVKLFWFFPPLEPPLPLYLPLDLPTTLLHFPLTFRLTLSREVSFTAASVT